METSDHIKIEAGDHITMELDDQIVHRHMVRLFSNFNELRHRGQLFDFKICVGNKKLNAHKVVLAASSDYFKAMFAHNSIELDAGKVFLQNIDANAVEAVINYIYTCKIDLNNENIEEILLAASILQVQVIQDLCVDFIEKRIDASNCLGVALLSERCSLLELNCKALNYCYENFNQVVLEKEFLTLDDSMLARIISQDKLNVYDETQVFQAVITWVKADEEQRKSKLDKLMRHVRFATIEPVTFVNLTTVDLIKASPECRDLIDKAKNYLLLKDYPELQKQHLGKLVTRPRDVLRRIYAVGGWTDEFTAISSAEVYDPKLDIWTEIPPMTQKRCGVGLTTLRHSIYAVGGHDGQNHVNTVERFDVNNYKWYKDVADMQYGRSNVGVVTLDGFIYAIGGKIGLVSLDSVERYDPINNVWEECAPMTVKRVGHGVAVYKGCIYVIGGCESEGHTLNTVEKYDPKENKWVHVAPMGIARKHLGSCTCQGLIYAIGGRNDSASQLDSGEVYDPTKDKWTAIPSMHKKRSGIGLVELSGLVYVIGGQNQDTRLSEVEAYDPVAKSWTWKRPMNDSRLGGGVTVHPMQST
uniref:Kelch-like protein diablo n=1 Tax=Aceria tosichella TaxID=561515 RepID=A0A6G1SFI5_9ACAR